MVFDEDDADDEKRGREHACITGFGITHELYGTIYDHRTREQY